ncbi:hypothetical protein C3F09_00715 [candidate division GN15 bacterium]|uniref:Uncharacterized protein n=1 Tax=candidate division GN15 bacterium TaxID=2072418 RepID=A0A855XD58_9BACT|nr:MAG: hypothetical protein C3F09_00715 [candidate division GN15 bacterium]
MSRILKTVRGVYVLIALALTACFFYIWIWPSIALQDRAQGVARFRSIMGGVRLEGFDTPFLTNNSYVERLIA